MNELTILSPHRDDAAFSLCLLLARWSQAGVPIRIVNFFTVSNYGPRTPAEGASAISAVREREDRRALASISRTIRIKDEGLLDAPIRLGIHWKTVCQTKENGDELETIARFMSRHVAHGLVLAPLGLGDHVDHLLTRDGAIAAIRSPKQLAFYEDLPYATWTSEEALRAKVKMAENRTRTPLRPQIIRAPHAVRSKRRIVARYTSQIGHQEAQAIANYSVRYGGGERIWVPRHARAWAPFPTTY